MKTENSANNNISGSTQKSSRGKQVIIAYLLLGLAIASGIYSYEVKNKVYMRFGLMNLTNNLTIEETIERIGDHGHPVMKQIKKDAEIALKRKQTLLGGLYIAVVIFTIFALNILLKPWFDKRQQSIE